MAKRVGEGGGLRTGTTGESAEREATLAMIRRCAVHQRDVEPPSLVDSGLLSRDAPPPPTPEVVPPSDRGWPDVRPLEEAPIWD